TYGRSVPSCTKGPAHALAVQPRLRRDDWPASPYWPAGPSGDLAAGDRGISDNAILPSHMPVGYHLPSVYEHMHRASRGRMMHERTGNVVDRLHHFENREIGAFANLD